MADIASNVVSGEFTCPLCELPVRFVIEVKPFVIGRQIMLHADQAKTIAEDHAETCAGHPS